MKILILGSKEYPFGTIKESNPSGGMEKYITDLVKYLTDDSTPIIVTRRPTKPREQHHPKIIIHDVRYINKPILRNISFNFNSFACARKLDFDVILSNGVVATLFARIIGKLKRKKVVAIPHGLAHIQPQYNKFLKTILKSMEKQAYRENVIFLSTQERDNFKKRMGFLPKNYKIIQPGVEYNKPDSYWVNMFKYLHCRNKFTITTVGRLVKVKGIDTFIKAAKTINNNDVNFLIVGDGPEMENLKSLVGDDNRIKFLGWRDDIDIIMEAIDVFVLPSHSEGLPQILLKAMRHAKPIIVSDIGLPIENNRDGLVFKPGDYKDLADKINIIINNPQKGKIMGKFAREKVLKNYNWKKLAKETISFLGS